MGLFGSKCAFCNNEKAVKGQLCINCDRMIKARTMEIKGKLDSLMHSREIEFKRGNNIKEYLLDTADALNLYKQLYEYAVFFPNEIIIKPNNFEELKNNTFKETNDYLEYKIKNYIDDNKYLLLLKNDFEYYKKVYPEFAEMFNITLIEQHLHEYDNISIDPNEIIKELDDLDGIEFEKYIGELLVKLEYKNVKVTPASGDYGIDVLAEKDGIKYAIQCKKYQNPLGNKCVQEAYSGKQYYNCHVGVVATNSTFTPNAKNLADKNGILLWDGEKLKQMIKEANEN